MDWNERMKDDTIGIANFDLKSLAEDGQQEGLSVPIMHEGKPRGELKFDAVYYPVLTPIALADGTIDPIPETSSGVVRLTVHQAKELDPRDKQIDPFAKVMLNGVVVHRTQTLKRTPNPVWERPTEFLVTDKSSLSSPLLSSRTVLTLNDRCYDWSLSLGRQLLWWKRLARTDQGQARGIARSEDEATRLVLTEWSEIWSSSYQRRMETYSHGWVDERSE